jgi:putative cell wall-binding protein
MRRALSLAMLTLAAVPALISVPVLGRPAAAPHAVTPLLVSLPLSGVDAATLAEVRAATPATAAAAVAAAAAAVAVAAPATAPGRVAVSSVVAAIPAVLTGRIATKRFDLVAVSWNRSAAVPGATISVRVHEQGDWSGWQPLAQDDDGPDAGSSDAVGATATGAQDATSPLLTGGADGVQVRLDSPTGRVPAGLKLDLIDGGRSSADAPVAGPADSALAATGEPTIVTRAQWGADESLVKAPAVVNGGVKAMLLHHTETTNSYSAAQSYAQMRSVYAFHTKVRGWNDVGYNLLVDRFGTVYEGRRGSLTAPVMGAHAGGFNAQTLGVAVIGSFSTVRAPAAAESAVVRLLAWQAARYDINPRGRVYLTSAGGSYTKYKAGASVGILAVSGHRDVDSTECPGNDFYPDLSSIRARVAALMVPELLSPTITGGMATVGVPSIGFTAAVATRQRWWMTMTALCGGPTVRTISGTTSTRINGQWDLRDTAGVPVPAGAYTVSVSSSSPVGVIPIWRRDVEVLASSTGPVSRLPIRVISPTAGTSSVPTTAAVTTTTTATTATTAATTSTGITSATATVSSTVSTSTVSTSTLPTVSVTTMPTIVPTAPVTTSVTTSASTSAITPGTLIGGATSAGTGCPVQRTAAADPALTSVLAARVSHPDARTVVLVNAGGPEPLGQALAAAPLAAARNAALLLTDVSALPAAVAQDIVARGVSTAYLVGSTAVINPAVEEQLRALGVTSVVRVAGTDRWSTAAAVAALVGAPSHEAVLAPGDPNELLDTLVAAGSSAAAGRPILLTSRAGVPSATLAALKTLKINSVTVVGSTVAIPERTLAVLAKAGVTHRTRVVGKDRWTTAVAVANAFKGRVPFDRVVLASGLEVGPDLLVASGQARTIMLSGTDVLPAESSQWLSAHGSATVSLVAGPAAVHTSVLRAAQAARG